jgi:hypothetical protein
MEKGLERMLDVRPFCIEGSYVQAGPEASRGRLPDVWKLLSIVRKGYALGLA